jgi:hypothetical protein
LVISIKNNKKFPQKRSKSHAGSHVVVIDPDIKPVSPTYDLL